MTDLASRFKSSSLDALPPASVLRLVVVVVGGLLVLQSTQGLAPPKLIYLAVAGIAFVLSCRAVLNLRGRPMFAAARPWLIASILLFALIVLSLPVAMLHGTPLSAWLRDAATYGLFAAAPIFALDAASSMRFRLLLRLVVVVAGLGAVSFAIYWITLRNLAILPFDQFVLPTASLPTTLFVVSMSAAVVDRRNRLGWIILGGIALGLFLVAGTRSALFLLIALPVVVVLAGRPFLARSVSAALGVGLVAAGFLLAIQTTFLVAGRAVAPPIDVAAPIATPGTDVGSPPGTGQVGATPTASGATPTASGVTPTASAVSPADRTPVPQQAPNPDANIAQRLQDFLTAPERDGSVRERIAQYGVAWDLFTTSPIVGVGLGHPFTWTRLDGTVYTDFTADTPLILPAKLGILGLAWMVLLAGVWIRFVLLLRRRAGVNIPGLAMAGWAAVLLALLWAGFQLEDKGFSFALMLLLALGFMEIERTPVPDGPDPSRLMAV
jgi:hypothetical protein